MAIWWQAVGGTRYQIESAERLSGTNAVFQPNYQIAATELQSGQYGVSTNAVFIDTRPAPAAGSRFYRIQVVP